MEEKNVFSQIRDSSKLFGEGANLYMGVWYEGQEKDLEPHYTGYEPLLYFLLCLWTLSKLLNSVSQFPQL